MNIRLFLPVLLVAALLMPACQTRQKRGSVEEGYAPGQLVPFVPRAVRVPIQLAEGRYPDLFSADSYAEWVRERPSGDDSAGAASELDRNAALLSGSMLVLKCFLGSGFADSSIAYDVVGMRGVNVFLVAPDGSRQMPAQRVIGGELKEARRGAIKAFGRTSLLAFPIKQIDAILPYPGEMAEPARLVVEGYDTLFYFEWTPSLPALTKAGPLSERESVKQAKESWRKATAKTKDVLHTFD